MNKEYEFLFPNRFHFDYKFETNRGIFSFAKNISSSPPGYVISKIFQNKPIWIFTLLILLLSFFLLFENQSPLYDQDEAAYAGFARTMVETSDYLNIHFAFSEPHRKPPLHFWLTSFIFQHLGVSEWNLRLLPSIWIIMSCILTYLLGKSMFGEKVGLYSFCILGFSTYFPLNGKIALVDSLLTFIEILGFISLYFFITKQKQIFKFLFWFSIAVGTLTKGPPILIFLGGTCFLLLFQLKTREAIWKLQPFLFLPISLSPLLIWGFLVWQNTDGELIRWMVDWYILRRASNPVFGQAGPPGTYLLLFFITLFPWSLYYTKILRDLWNILKKAYASIGSKQIFKTENNFETNFLYIGLIFSWLFYEFLASKLPSYPLAAYPLLSILIAKKMEGVTTFFSFKNLFVFSIVWMVTIIIILLPWMNNKRFDTKTVAEKINRLELKTDSIYVNGNLGLPSLAYYLKTPLKEFEANYLTNKDDKFILATTNDLLLLNQLQTNILVVGGPYPIYAYDRNKTIELYVIKTSNNN
ncbi:glycosyltransferase family 39 protein [Leptospira sp. 96542]|nr:glycosyltransferase family 39 protein [Leptospira sp. 96542]